MQRITKLLDSFERSPISFWLCLGSLFIVVLAFHGRPVPSNNEFIYLLRLDPGIFPNDWSFSQPANEHWLFNFIFGLPLHLFSIGVAGWLGRIVFWVLCLAALLKLGKLWNIPVIAATVSIGLWLGMNQSVVNAEWMFGGFEAKVVAYTCLLFSLFGFSKGQITIPAILLGLSFSFHPAVGLWAVPAVGIALLAERLPIADLSKVVGLTFIACLPGIVPLLTEQVAAQPTDSGMWQFIVTVHMPFHFDPYYFSKIGMTVLGVMLIFNIVTLWNSDKFALRFIRNFQIAIAAFFLIGILMRFLEAYSLLRFMPMRLFPILTPLFFLFSAFYLFAKLDLAAKKILVAVVVIAAFSFLHPIDEAIDQMRMTKESWSSTSNDNAVCLNWISKNTPKDAVILASPVGREFWYWSNRAQIVSYMYPRYDRLVEWRQRIADLTGGVQIVSRESSREDIETGFANLSTDQVIALKEKYEANYLLSRTVYPFPVIFETETYKVYQLP